MYTKKYKKVFNSYIPFLYIYIYTKKNYKKYFYVPQK